MAEEDNTIELKKIQLSEKILPALIQTFGDATGPQTSPSVGPFRKSRASNFDVISDNYTGTLMLMHVELYSHADEDNFPAIQRELFQTVYEKDGIFTAFRKLLETTLRSEMLFMDSNPCVPNLITRILKDGARSCVEFSEQLCEESGLFEVLIWTTQKLREKHMKNKLIESTDATLTNCLGIFYECSKHLQNIYRIRSLGIVDICQGYFDSSSAEIRKLSILCAMYLVDEKQNKIFKPGKKCRILRVIEALDQALLSDNLQFEGWSCEELIQGIRHFVTTDANKAMAMDGGCIPLLSKAAQITESSTIQKEAIHALWSLAFKADYKPVIRRNKLLMDCLTDLAAEGPANTCWRVAKGLIWSVRDSLEFHQSKDNPGFLHIMISYHWQDRESAMGIRKALKASDYNVWIEEEAKEGPTIDDVKMAMEHSIVVLLCMSQWYKHSVSCRTEAELACTKNRDVIPLVVEGKYRPDGWLGMMTASRLSLDLSDSKVFDVRMKELIKVLGNRGRK